MPEPNDSPPPEEEKRKEDKVFGIGAVTQSQVQNSANPSLLENTYDQRLYEDSPSNEERMDTSNGNEEPSSNDNDIGTDDNNKPTENTENKGMLGEFHYLALSFRIDSIINYSIVIFRISSFSRDRGSCQRWQNDRLL